jgi:hypothetical protein
LELCRLELSRLELGRLELSWLELGRLELRLLGSISNKMEDKIMQTIISSPRKLLAVFMLVVCLTVLFLATLYYAQTFMPNISWHEMTSIGWNG